VKGSRTISLLLALAAAATACQLRRPDVVAARMIEPQLPEPTATDGSTSGPVAVRILDTQSRSHIGRWVLHQEAGGELVEDLVWRWSSAPDRYLDSSLRLAAPHAGVQLVDVGNAPTMAVTLIAWNLYSRRPVGPHARDPRQRTGVVRAAGRPGSRRGPSHELAGSGKFQTGRSQSQNRPLATLTRPRARRTVSARAMSALFR